MKVKQITLGSSTLALAALLTACGGSSSSGVQKPTPLVANTNTNNSGNQGNHGATNQGNHGATNHGNHGANNHGNHGANNHGNHGNHGATNQGNHGATNHGNHGANNHGNHGNHGANNHGNHGATNPAPKWDATVRYASLKNDAAKEAKDYVREKDGVVPEITGYTLSIDGKTQNSDIDLSKYRKGYGGLNIHETVTGKVKGKSASITRESTAYLFKQDYSLVAGIHNKNLTTVLGDQKQTKPINEVNFFVRGTPTEILPTTGNFDYAAAGMVRSQSGVKVFGFKYNVDFGAKTGSGRLGNINLLESNIKTVTHTNDLGDRLSTHGIEGKATDGRLNGEYTLGFFGPNADEIAGSVELGNDKDVIGVFGGTKKVQYAQ